MDPLFAAAIFVLGLMFGSFLNVCIYRLPRELSVVAPRSACPQCHQLIAFYDNIPVLSWLILAAVTLVSWWIGAGHGSGPLRADAAVTTGVLLIAALKIRIIMREFMEVRHAPAWLRRLTDAWIGVVLTSLLGIYFLGVGVRA